MVNRRRNSGTTATSKHRTVRGQRSRLKLSHRRHSGKMLPRHHSSYGLLLFLLLLLGMIVAYSMKATLEDSPRTLGETVTVSANVAGPPPASSATITFPVNEQMFTSNPVSVRGVCPDDVIVEIYRNSIYAGASACDHNSFELKIDLAEGENKLIAKVIDTLGQYGPDSSAVTVSFKPARPVQQPVSTQPPAVGSGAPVPVSQLLLSTDTFYTGVLPGQKFMLPLRVTGGHAPYALMVNWGDGQTEIISHPGSSSAELSHFYKQSGSYHVTIEASDSLGNKAYLQTVIIANGKTIITKQIDSIIDYVPQPFLVVWPIYISALALIGTFWLGERYELYKLRKPVDKKV